MTTFMTYKEESEYLRQQLAEKDAEMARLKASWQSVAIEDMAKQLAASQAREGQLREALEYHRDVNCTNIQAYKLRDEALALPQDTTALDALIAKAGEVMRELAPPLSLPQHQRNKMKTAQMNVDCIDYMGSDLTVVNAARVSFDKRSEWEDEGDEDGNNVLSERDTKLINYLAKHNHWSPFAHTSIQLRIKAPIFVARQLVKHQVGGVWNEVSRRYVDSEPEFWFPDVWRGRPEGSMKQGSSPVMRGDVDVTVNTIFKSTKQALTAYNLALANDIAPEQARMILPQNMMTEWYWTGSLMFFCRVCRERLAPGAQQETREVAEQIAEIAASLFPVSWSALMEN